MGVRSRLPWSGNRVTNRGYENEFFDKGGGPYGRVGKGKDGQVYTGLTTVLSEGRKILSCTEERGRPDCP